MKNLFTLILSTETKRRILQLGNPSLEITSSNVLLSSLPECPLTSSGRGCSCGRTAVVASSDSGRDRLKTL